MTIQDILLVTPLDTWHHESLEETARFFCTQTRFDGKLVINQSVFPGMLGVFFVKFDPAGPLRALRNNCLYVPCAEDRHMVLCDFDFVTDWRNALPDQKGSEELAKAKMPTTFVSASPEDYEEGFKVMFRAHLFYVFYRWVIGHEIGHAALQHGSAHSFELGDPSARRRLSIEQELAADRFVIDHMWNDEEARMHFFGAITHLLNHWILNETGVTSVDLGDKDYRGQPVAIRDNSVTHPPMVMRLLNLMDAFLERFPDTDTTGFYKRVRAHVVPVAS